MNLIFLIKVSLDNSKPLNKLIQKLTTLCEDDLLFIYEISAKTLLNVLLKYHEPANVASRPNDTEFLTNMVIQFANQFVCQVDLQLKLVTRQIKFIDIICKVIECRLEKSTLDDTLKPSFY